MVRPLARMRLASVVALSLVASIAAAGCGDDAARDPAPHADVAPEAATPSSKRATAPEESGDERDEVADAGADDAPRRSTAAAPLTAAERVIATALGASEDAEAAFDALDDGRKIAVLRAALRMDGTPAALFAAENAEHAWLDLAEMRLAAAILVREGLRPGAEDAASTLASAFEFGGSPDVATVMAALAENPAPLADGGSIESLHKLLRADHAPLVAKLLERDETRATGEEFAGQLRKRSAAARAVLPKAMADDDAAHRAEDGDLGETRVAALEPLVAESGRYSAFRTLRDADPVAARRALERLLTSGSDEAVGVFLEDMHENEVWPSPWIATRQESPVYADLDAAVIPAITSPRRLAAIALSVPGCGTRRMAEAIVERCASQAPLNEAEARAFAPERGQAWHHPKPIHLFLDAAARGAFLPLLRSWADARPHEFIPLLFEAGDSPSTPQLLAYAARGERAEIHEPRDWRRIRDPRVRKRLVDELQASPPPANAERWYVTIAVLDGLPESAGVGLADRLSEGGDASSILPPDACRLILDARPIDALCAVLAAKPDFFAIGLGEVRDPRVVAHLRGLLDKRDVVTYRDVLDELAHAGDEAARAELRAGVEEGRYRWITDMTGRQTALGGDPRDVYELWCRQLETNCCVDCCADGNYFEHWFGFSPREIAESSEFRTTAASPREIAQPAEFRTTAADAARAWWKLHEGRFVWSDLAGHYVPEPR